MPFLSRDDGDPQQICERLGSSGAGAWGQRPTRGALLRRPARIDPSRAYGGSIVDLGSRRLRLTVTDEQAEESGKRKPAALYAGDWPSSRAKRWKHIRGAGVKLAQRALTNFEAEISHFNAGGATGYAFGLFDKWTRGHFTENAGGTGGTGRTLALTSGTSALTLNFLGQYQDGQFHAAIVSGETTLTYSGKISANR